MEDLFLASAVLIVHHSVSLINTKENDYAPLLDATVPRNSSAGHHRATGRRIDQWRFRGGQFGGMDSHQSGRRIWIVVRRYTGYHGAPFRSVDICCRR